MTAKKTATSTSSVIAATATAQYVNDTVSKIKQCVESQNSALSILMQNESLNVDSIKKTVTSIKSNTALMSLLTVSADVAQIVADEQIDIVSMLSEKTKDTREAKLRLIKHLQAFASNNVDKLATCDARLYSAIFAKRDSCALDKALTTQKIQHVMQHDTTTQANYFSNFASFLKIATVKRKERNQFESITIRSDSALVQRLQKLFA